MADYRGHSVPDLEDVMTGCMREYKLVWERLKPGALTNRQPPSESVMEVNARLRIRPHVVRKLSLLRFVIALARAFRRLRGDKVLTLVGNCFIVHTLQVIDRTINGSVLECMCWGWHLRKTF